MLPFLARSYAPVGQTPVLRAPLSYDHLSVISAITPDGRLFTHVQDETFRGPTIVGFLRQLLRQVPGKLLVIWDGAPGHRDARVERIGLPLVALPPSSPELTLAERLFEAIRAEIEGEVSADLDAKCARVAAILADWDRHPERVRSLAAWPWLRDAFNHLSALSTA